MTTPLPPNDSSTTDDQLPGEAELAALYRQLPQSEPGPALDAAVLQAAAQALDDADHPPRTERRKGARESGDWVHPRPRSAAASRAIPSLESGAYHPRRVPPWVVALSSAASLVLVAGLTWHMRTAPVGNTVQADRVAPAPMAAAPSQATPMADDAGARATAQAEVLANRAKRQSMARGAADSVAPVIVTEPATQPSAARHRPSPQSAKPAATNAYAARVSAPAAMAMPPPPPPVQEISAAPPAALPPPPAPPAPQASLLPTSLAVSAQVSTKKAAETRDTPEHELDAIQQLFAQGHDDEARQRLLDFRRAHPRWPLPPALQAQLPKP
jgi:hypothetical protein